MLVCNELLYFNDQWTWKEPLSLTYGHKIEVDFSLLLSRANKHLDKIYTQGGTS